MAEAATEVFDAIFLQRTDAAGDSVDTPEGANVKRYGASQGAYGIVKQRISPLSTDVESEVAASLLAEMLGMPCCRAWRFGDDAVFSAFEYDFTCEYLVHMRRLFDGPRGENELENLLAVRPQYADDLYRMIAFDFITRQDDRHLSNIAVLVTEGGEVFYPLYDNGRSLFYEDTESFARKAAARSQASPILMMKASMREFARASFGVPSRATPRDATKARRCLPEGTAHDLRILTWKAFRWG